MPPMRRRLFKLASLISLVLCVLTIVLWISTYFRAVRYTKISLSAGGSHPLFLMVLTARGELSFEVGSNYVFNIKDAADQRRIDGIIRNYSAWTFYPGPWDYQPLDRTSPGITGFRLTSYRITSGPIGVRGTFLDVPIAFLVLLFAILPAGRPVLRLAKILRQAPPAIRKKSRGRTTALALTCLAMFLLFQLALLFTQSTGWSVRFARTGGTLFELGAQHRRLRVTLIGGWPESQPLTFIRTPDETRPLYPFREGNTWLINSNSFVGVSWSDGLLPFFLNEDGSIAHLPYGKNSYYIRTLAGLPFHQVQLSLIELGLPFMLVFVVWAVVRIRARVKRFIARRDSLCVGCGYALHGNTSGVCPECGSAIAGA